MSHIGGSSSPLSGKRDQFGTQTVARLALLWSNCGLLVVRLWSDVEHFVVRLWSNVEQFVVRLWSCVEDLWSSLWSDCALLVVVRLWSWSDCGF